MAAALANWNGAAHIDRCLSALYAQTIALDEVVIVDNGSTDGSVEWIEQHYPHATLLYNPENLGYCVGYNRAIAATSTSLVLILNTDVFLDPCYVETACEVFTREDLTSAVTGQFFEEGTQQQISGGFGLRRQMRIVPESPLGEEREVFGVSGAAALFRRSALEEASVDGEIFDTDYFSYGEDIDLAWRLRLLGWQARYTPEAKAHHVGSGSLSGRLRFVDKPAFFQRHVLKNRYLTVAKNASAAQLPEFAFSLLLSEFLLWPYLLLHKPLRIPYLLGTWWDVLRLLPRAWRRRRELHGRLRASSASIRPFLRGF
ncbi:MAG: glycosyltransferase family 2 protein [Candidatus Latescibacterota bacterium]|nr:glycosyltransferase family 2 protein [Candidatus Latescibacterota bacterium]